MILAIDSGNTNVVFALIRGQKIQAQWRIESSDRRTADEYFVWLSQLMTLKGFMVHEVETVVIANVRPASAFALERLSREHLSCEPHVVGKGGFKVDLEVRLPNSAQLGADRLVNAYAAKMEGLTPAILIDTGTATTFDILDRTGAYVGGIIAPGVHVSAKALADAAAQLPLISVEQPPSPIGTDTRSAMQSGLFWGYVSMLEGMVARVKQTMIAEGHGEPNQHIQVIGTGGLMKILGRGMAHLDRVDPDLTLRGLALIIANLKSNLGPRASTILKKENL